MWFPGEPFPTQITLPLKLNADLELTCFVCKSKRLCELCIEVAYPGCKLWYGIHAECIPIVQMKKKRKFILRVHDEDAGIMYFENQSTFVDDCKTRGDESYKNEDLMKALRLGESWADKTTEYKWVEVIE